MERNKEENAVAEDAKNQDGNAIVQVMLLKAKNVWVLRVVKINRHTDLFKLQNVLNKNHIFCQPEIGNRYLVVRWRGISLKVFSNGTLCITHKGKQLPGNFHKILDLIKEVE